MEDAIPHLDVDRLALPVFKDAAWAYGDDFTLLRLLLRRIGEDDPARRLLVARDRLYDHAVAEGSE
jgi:hypothetical protein